MLLYISLTVTLLCNVNLVHSKTPSVIIVGAGPAGIAAASKLLENSITNITILEAENRIGGRINTVSFGESLVELGAEFCHGEKGNVVYELAKDFNILDRTYRVSDEIMLYSNGSKINFELKTEIQAVIYDDDDSEDYNRTGRSKKEFFIHRYNATLLTKYANDKDKVKILNEALRYAEGTFLGMEAAFSWSDLSAEDYYEGCEGHQLLVWKGVGYKTILEILTKSYPDPSQKLPIDTRIRLGTEVRTIFWNQSEKIQILTSDNETYTADYVIFTPSMGVLKHQKEEMFNPSLPPSKLEAIEAIGFEAVIKVIIHFPTKWWNDSDYLFSFLWSEEDLLNTGVNFPDGPSKNGISWISQFRAMNRVFYNSNVWVIWITGDLVPEIEKLPLQSLKNGSQYIINKFLGRIYNVTEIDQIIASNWYSNKHFRGSYSYFRTGMYKSSREKLAEPLENSSGKPVVLFAGEATHAKHFQTVHGAIESGFREAKRIIELHQEQN